MRAPTRRPHVSPGAEPLPAIPLHVYLPLRLYICSDSHLEPQPGRGETEVACELGSHRKGTICVCRAGGRTFCGAGAEDSQRMSLKGKHLPLEMKLELQHPQVIPRVSAEHLRAPANRGSGWREKGCALRAGCGRSGVTGARASKRLYSLPNSNFPPEPRSFPTLSFLRLRVHFGENN